MKRLATLICTIVILAGCGSHENAMKKSLSLRDELLNANGCTFRAEVTADYGDAIYTFSMDVTANDQGNTVFSVVEPDSIAGITGMISQSAAALTFDDKVLAIPLLTDDQLSPVSAPWIFLNALRSGYITGVGKEDVLLRISIDDSYADDALTVDIWVTEEQLPVHSQILYKGRSILTLSIKDYQLV